MEILVYTAQSREAKTEIPGTLFKAARPERKSFCVGKEKHDDSS